MKRVSPTQWHHDAQSQNIALDVAIADALAQDPIIVFSLSGGKDSSAATLATIAFLDAIGHPAKNRYAIHADLGLIEWPTTTDFVAQIAAELALPLSIVQNSTKGLLPRWRQRFENAKRRYANLETYNLIGPFSSASLRFCTSDTKIGPIGSHLAKAHRGRTIISVVGIRREESASRASAPVSRQDTRFASPSNRFGTKMITWHPILEWSADEVYAYHEARQFPLHVAYTRYRMSRLSCAHCVLASAADARKSIDSGQNEASLNEIVELEITSTFSFQPTRWLSDLAPATSYPDLTSALATAKSLGTERKTLESQLPSDLRFTRGWPPRVPDMDEAKTIAMAREVILAHHNLPNLYPTPAAVTDRFARLHACKPRLIAA